MLAAARSDIELKDGIFDGYYEKLCDTLAQNGGVLSERKYTEYSRTVIALTAMGKDPQNAAGYDITEKLADFDAVKKQGVNGSIYALIALDCGNYTIPKTKGGTQATRALYTEHILSAQKADGGFALSGENGDADVTAMALQALAKYKDDEKIGAAVEKALVWLSENQLEDGGYATVGEATCESSAQVLTALCALGIDPDTDGRFIKNGSTVCDSILSHCESSNADIAEQQGCVKREWIFEYSKGEEVKGMHISDLIIYDKPKELSEFYKHDCTYDNAFGYAFEDRNKEIPLSRPPQSWCYVEEKEVD